MGCGTAGEQTRDAREGKMFRLIFNLYGLGILVFFALFVALAPETPVVDAVLSAVLWPYGVYRQWLA